MASTPPGSQFTIEPATWRDLSQLRDLERVCFPLDAWPLWDLIGVLTLPNVIRLKVMIEARMVGFAAVDLRPGEKTGWIATIGVLPEYRKRGIGAALLTEIEKKISLPHIRLCVRVSNHDAIHLYEQFGYQQVSTWPGYYQNGESALVMEKNL